MWEHLHVLKMLRSNSANVVAIAPVPMRLLSHIPKAICCHQPLCLFVPTVNCQTHSITIFVKVVVDRSSTMFVTVVVATWNLMLKIVRSAKQLLVLIGGRLSNRQ
jgi:hypothetical protein